MRKGAKGFMGLALVAVAVSCLLVVEAADADLASECSKDFQSVMTCLNFAQGKAATPSTECCSSVSSIREDRPKCLCFILLQTKTSGAQNLKNLGVQEAKLFQLPTACQLKNSSVSDCPTLLGLAPNSPEAAVFSNISTAATTTPATGTSSSASEQSDSNKSGGTKLVAGNQLFGYTLLIVSAVFFYGFASLF
ncbi:hypothetical protein COLO4_20410 [Corchorus olitorius]|uniref:Bifunctional inhibitor/plant lipid transfer protein/seed storage helical domain-containing protein n=1 Tax=Corchorus olitorius TaxID=93759 RepID=A0A1R3J031_9ROSI|nr:hypothetical protein COLO4_20410 [Corchorus olitorius]